MTKKMLRGTALAVSMALFAGMLGGCGTKEESEATQATETAAVQAEEKATEAAKETTEKRDTIIIATANEPAGISTYLQNSQAAGYINTLTNNCLFYRDENLNLQPGLCESYENISETEWIFHLRQGVKYHNGMEMTAADVKASIELARQSPAVAQYAQSPGTIEIIDDYTVKMTTDGPQANLLFDLSAFGNSILPAELIENGHDFNKEPIGTGPYVFKEWNKGDSLVFEAFDDYFKGEPAIENLIWKIVPEGPSRTLALEAGEVDVVLEVESMDVDRLKESPEFEVFEERGTNTFYIMTNNQAAPFDNEAYRKAVSSAIDRDAIIKVALNGSGSPLFGCLTTGFDGVSEEGAPTYDTEAAKAYFEESGLTPEEAAFTLICSDDTKLRAGQVIQAAMKEVLGVEVSLESMDQSTYLDTTAKGEHQAAIGSFAPPSILLFSTSVYHSRSIGGTNRTLTNVPEVDAQIEKLEATLDKEEFDAAVAELSALVNDICPMVPMYIQNNVRAYNADLEGFNCIPTGIMRFENVSWK